MGFRLNAAIAESIITTTKEKTDKEISHDTANALNTLSEIFDKKKIEEKQEYVNTLSQVGYRLIGDIAGHKENELYKKAEKARKENNSMLAEKYEKEAKKWSENGTNRIAMHGIMGALVSKEAGAGMTKGLTGAGLNALLQKELGKIKAPEVHKMASAAIGYLAGGKTGTAIAHQATTFNYLTHEQYKQYLDDMKNAKTEEEKKRLQKDWEAIDERQRYSPISTPGTYWDLKTGRPFMVKEGGNLFEPVLVTATRAHGETIFESAMSSAINAKIAKYLGRETVIGDALTLPWDIANDANIDKYGIQGVKRRIGMDIYGNLIVMFAGAKIGGIKGGSTGIFSVLGLTEIKEAIFNYLTHEQYEQYLDDMKNAKTEEEKKRLQKDWEAIDEKQRYSPISTPGTYWDLKTGRPFTVKEGGSLFEPVLVTATRAHRETLFESAMASAINAKVTKYLGRETVIGDALTLPWDIAKDADINKYGIQGAKRRIGIDIYGNLMVVGTTVFTGGTFGGILKGLGASIVIEEIKEYGAPSLTVQERENADNEYIEKINREMD